MTTTPSGRLVGTGEGADLVLTRRFRASVADVWASITDPDRTARWFGRWEGDAGPGRTIKVQMAYEDDAPWFDLLIEACEPPRRLVASMVDEHGSWHVEMRLAEAAGSTELTFTQHLESTDGVGETGPGWEYYLDLLVAAHTGEPQREFDDYYPAMKDYYEGLRQE
ncbi:SRPBCC family protein [Micromonospora endolithica]|uniref:SRPBCC family protein n=1 Tax=Micromonospora endolithica TaxID=230091 RepID=A0A3A9ZJ58_9ACTN|nr:SRPBCC family protein [Micromonospora endolithica]RKN47804.1 SRPBCC family protein [Micromonospora endolithica]TWJ21486.1 uncharacterized protein YndB with AHSA1/START domain [Micromonospora endolithica]